MSTGHFNSVISEITMEHRLPEHTDKIILLRGRVPDAYQGHKCGDVGNGDARTRFAGHDGWQ